ncbi:lysozyme [Rhizobium laguerreae]
MRASIFILILLASLTAINLAKAQESDAPLDFTKPILPPDWLPSGTQVEIQKGTLPAAAADDGTPPRRILFVSLGLIKRFEGWFPDVYNDPVGYCTIGWGHLIEKKLCRNVATDKLGAFSPRPLDPDRGQSLLIKDTWPARRAVQRLVKVQVTDRQFGALTSFVYNVGAENFRRSTMLRMLNTGNISGAQREFSRWNRARGKVLPGLVRRRACEAELFMGRGRNLNNGLFDIRICRGNLAAAESIVDPIDIDVGEVAP